ncbi:hypothetical protein [Alkalihalobacterium bogoriense]|uniref:hypothetical protein n=1 Tax=Alkalihalobacterium bogoriense TaxID=246272 RepID=UPI00047B5C63|nr:hypothetical protein [Alkalihalobacterium bogoriense]
MLTWFGVLFFTTLLGLMMGGLLVSKRNLPQHKLILAVVIMFAGMTYVGMLLGSIVSSFLSIIVIKVFMTICAVLFIVVCLSQFHSTLGFFYTKEKIVWAPLLVLFLLFGMEWAFADISPWVIILASLLFMGTMMAGTFVQVMIQEKAWRIPYSAFIPFVWLLFIVIIKLV